MSPTPQEFQDFIGQQRADYRRVLPDKVAEIQAVWQVADRGGVPQLLALERLAHTLAGTAGTLGFPAVGQAAKALELLLPENETATAPLTPAQQSDIAQAVAALQASLPPD